MGAVGFVPKDELPGPPLRRLISGDRPEGYGWHVSEPLRVIVGEDDVLLREGIARLLGEFGFDVVAQAGDADDLLRKALAHRPDVVVVDVQMPPRREDDGLRAAMQLRRQLPPSACSCCRSSTRSPTRST